MKKLKSLLLGAAILASIPVSATVYTAPNGGFYVDNYLTHIWSTGADENINIEYSNHPGIYNLINGVTAGPGESFYINMVALSKGEYSESTVHEDMRFNACHIFVDWDASGTFVKEERYGNCKPTHNVGGNYDYVMNISHKFTVPETAEPNTQARIRVIYHNAWKYNSEGSIDPNLQDLDKGIAYDFVITIDDNVQEIVDVDYSTGQEDFSVGRNDRHTNALNIKDDCGHPELDITTLQSHQGSPIYFDKAGESFTTQSGAHVTITPTDGSAVNAMHRYFYIDRESDGFIYQDYTTYLTLDGDVPHLKDNSDLIFFSCFYASDSAKNYDSTGAEVQRGQSGSAASEFTIPNLPNGSYRCRYKVDWGNLDPRGTSGTTNTMSANGGIIVDFTIVIENSNPKQAAYDAFDAEIKGYLGVGFASSWESADGMTHYVANSLADLEMRIDEDAYTEGIFNDLINLKRNEILNNVTPKGLVRIVNRAHNDVALNYNLLNATEEDVYFNDAAPYGHYYYPHNLWFLEHKGDGVFGLKNHYSQTYVSSSKTNSGRPMAGTESNLTLDFTDGEYFGLHTGNADTPYINYPTGTENQALVDNCNSNNAQWKIAPFNGVELDDTDCYEHQESGNLVVTFKATGHSIGHLNQKYYAEHHVVTFAPLSVSAADYAPMRRENAAGVRTFAVNQSEYWSYNDDGTIVLTIPNVSKGDYTLSVPAGFFTTANELTAAKEYTINADTDTSIDEIGVEAACVIYDLQGRRLAAPTKGINIINGNKILVK